MLSRVSPLVLALALAMPQNANAAPLPFSQTVRVGRPLRPLKLSVTTSPEATVVVANGKSHSLPTRGARNVTVESIAVGPDAAVAVVRVEGENGDWAVVLGGRAGTTALVSGRTDWAGDPGERRMLLVEAASSGAGARFGYRYEGLSACSATLPLLDAKQVDPITLEALPTSGLAPAAASTNATESAVAAREPSVDVTVTDTTLMDVTVEAVDGTPIVQAFNGLEPAGSSKVDDSTRFFLLPRAAVDGDVKTSWLMEEGDFFALRWPQAQLHVRSLAVDVAVEEATQGATIVVQADGQAPVRVSVPVVDAAKPPHTLTLRITPKAPLPLRCLAVIAENLPSKAKPLAIAEVRAYTEIDEAGGINRQVSLLVQDGPQGAQAADLLATLGEPGALAVASRYEELSPRGKRRALRVLAKGLSEPTVSQLVVHAAHDDDADVRTQALTVLKTGGESGRAALRLLALEASELGDTAAKTLAPQAGEAEALLQALGAEGGSERAGLREALTVSARRHPGPFTTAVEAFLPTASPAARASLALSASMAQNATLALALIEPALSSELPFAERYRFAEALAQAAPSESADAWLVQEATGASEWMMRRGAFDALAARNPSQVQAVATALSSDAYPRVRAASLNALVQTESWTRVADLAKSDAWPLVRIAGARALASRTESQPTLEALVSDPAPRVRASAIDSLSHLNAKTAWPAVVQRLTEKSESLEVVLSAVAFAREQCLVEAREPLVNIVRRTFRLDADDDDARAGVEALRTLHSLGGAAAADAKNLAGRPEAPPGLAKAYASFRPGQCGAPAAAGPQG